MGRNQHFQISGSAAVLAAFFLTLAGLFFPLRVLAGEGTINKGVMIQGVDVGGMTKEEACAAVSEEVSRLGAARVMLNVEGNVLSATLTELGYSWTNREVVDECLNLVSSGNIVERYKLSKDVEHQTVVYPLKTRVDRDRVLSFVKGAEAFDTEPVEGELLIGSDGLPYVEGGTDGIRVDLDASGEKVISAISAWTGGDISVDLPVTRKSPALSREKLSRVCDVLGTATTDYSFSSASRAVNVENGCRLISGAVLMPGESFSVTAAVTPFSAENGYEQAPSYEENRVVDSYGGGICQVSTTLYNAVLKAELEVIDRSNHTMLFSYVDPSKDAAIAEGIMDMAFVNNTEDPVILSGSASGGLLTFTIYGHETRPENRRIAFESKVLSEQAGKGTRLVADSTQPIGYVVQSQSPHTGMSAELWKSIYVDEVLVDSYRINSSYYQAVGEVYTIGVASNNSYFTQSMYKAIATNSLSYVQSVIQYCNTHGTPSSGTGAAQTSGSAEGSGQTTVNILQ